MTDFMENTLIKSAYTTKGILGENTLIKSVYTTKGILGENTLIKSRYGYALKYFMVNTLIKSRYRQLNYFNSSNPLRKPNPTIEERNSKFTAIIYICCPDLGTEYLLPGKDCDNLEIFWGLNQPIAASFKLLNKDLQYTTDDSGSDYYGLLEEGIYSFARSTRKYIKIQLVSFCGFTYEYLTFPRMVIKEVSGLYELNISCIDEISELLFRQTDLDTYCPEETLVAIDGEPKQFQSFSLTKNEYNSYTTEFFVNYARVTPAALDPENKIWYTSEDVDESYPVTVCNPLWVKWIISDLCKKVIDSQYSIISKEYFNIEFQCADFPVYCNIPVQNTEPIRIIEDICRVIPAEWYIKPDTDKLTLVIRPIYLDKEYSTDGDYYISPALVKGTPSIARTNIKRINTLNVIRPSILVTAKKKVVVTE